jgi:hypothetical protein
VSGDELDVVTAVNARNVNERVHFAFQVINWQQMLHIPPEADLSEETIDLIQRLCCSAETRLGRAPGGASDVKRHPFFAGIEFETLRQKRAPYVPQLLYPTDTSAQRVARFAAGTRLRWRRREQLQCGLVERGSQSRIPRIHVPPVFRRQRTGACHVFRPSRRR